MVQSHTYDNKKKIYKTKAIRNGSNKGNTLIRIIKIMPIILIRLIN